jgi:hypothetical protein
MNKHEQRRRVVRYYKDETKITDVDMKEVVKWASARGLIKLPPPPDPVDIEAKRFVDSAHEETRYDKKTGFPYCANVSYKHVEGDRQATLWADIDEPTTTRDKVVANAVMRREGMVNDGLKLTFTLDHWNSIHPEEKPVTVVMDLTEDIEERKNIPVEIQKAS